MPNAASITLNMDYIGFISWAYIGWESNVYIFFVYAYIIIVHKPNFSVRGHIFCTNLGTDQVSSEPWRRTETISEKEGRKRDNVRSSPNLLILPFSSAHHWLSIGIYEFSVGLILPGYPNRARGLSKGPNPIF